MTQDGDIERRVFMASKLASRLQPFSHPARIAVIFALLVVAFLPQFEARADTHCVSKTNPACSITIQQAIDLASAGDTVSVSAAVYHERITITKDLTLRGSRTSQLPALTTTINGDGLGNVVTIQGGARTVNLDTLRITNGNVGSGGGIYNSFTTHYLTLNNLILDGNYAGEGGGIYSASGSLVIVDTWIGNNRAILNGGGISARGALSLTRVTVTGNQTNIIYGGGVYQESGTFQAQDSNISNNAAHNDGGGLYFTDVTATLERVTIDGNQSVTAVGGGIMNVDSQISLTNVTLSGNSVTYSEGGAAIYTIATPDHDASVMLYAVTVANNSAPAGSGGGLVAYAYPTALHPATYTVASSIFADNPGGNCDIRSNATFSSSDYNISDDATCPLPYHADHLNTDAHLQPLAWNLPGYVKTHAILSNSPAHRNSEACPPTDARGVRRPALLCDSGAFDLTLYMYLPLVVRE
jgi:hypothetical protein